VITPEVEELRERFGMPGMRVLQFGFSDRGAHIYLPHKFVPNSVAYTGTHDNDTTLGWWRDGTGAVERANLETYLGPIAPDEAVVGAMMRAAAGSVANLCIFPMQDILGLGSEARMNTPAASQGNWTWRYGSGALKPESAEKLAELMVMTDRDGYVAPRYEAPKAGG
jgi:4-alpha-glucanotransferase